MAGLNRRAIVEALENPLMVVPVAKLVERRAKLLEIAKMADPE